MKKNLIIIWVFLGIFSWGMVFWWEIFLFGNNQPNIPWGYNPISGFYDQNTEEESVEEAEQDMFADMDFYSDDSFQRFLDDNHPLSWNYEAKDIVKIYSDFTTNKSSNFSLRKDVANAFELMAWAFSNAFDFKARLTINSAWRSQSYQRQLAASCSNTRCAKPWTSEHEAGLALDLWVNGGNIKAGSGKYYQWLVDNAHKYGFHNSYQKWMEIDGKMVEPRHWRYVWVDLATYLHEHNQTFTEYFYENIEPKNN